ncbi:MAG: MFS transporter [Candidatus Thorarchaeota archaeon]
MLDDHDSASSESQSQDRLEIREFLGLSPNLWRVALVMGIAQFSVGLWKWQFGIFLETVIAPWQMGLVFSCATFAGLIAAFVSGTIADLIGRKRTMAVGLVPVFIGLLTMSFFPSWPLLLLQYGLIWYGIGTTRIMSGAIPADEIAQDGRNPARRFMMIMVPHWLVDGVSPLLGAFLMSIGYAPTDLHRIASVASVVACIATLSLIRETLGSDIIEKARAGPIISFRRMGRDFWKMAVGMGGFYFSWAMAVQYLGNLSVDEWMVDTPFYGITWGAFGLASAILMYSASSLTDRNLKAALLVAVCGNGLVFLSFGIGTGATFLLVLNILWAVPFIIWLGAEKSLVLANVPEEAKGRALGTYSFIMSFLAIFAAMFGAVLWELSGTLRFVYVVAGIGMLCTILVLIPVLRTIKVESHDNRS